ncbi:MAG: hypothetical protein AABX10_01050 [Nanoarchaeota archaeon]
MKYILLFTLLFLVVFSSEASAQVKPKIIIEHITSWAQAASTPKSGSGFEIVSTVRVPVVEDVLDAMKKKKKVTLIVDMGPRISHAVRVVAVNLTSYNGTNQDNQTILYWNAEIFDPTTNAIYNLTLAHILESNASFLQWGAQWLPFLEVVTLYKVPTIPPSPARTKSIWLVSIPLLIENYKKPLARFDFLSHRSLFK